MYSSIGSRRQLARSGKQPTESTSEVGEADAVVDQGGGGFTDLGTYLIGGGPVGPVVWVRAVGDDPPQWEGLGRITPQGGPQAD